MTRTILSVAALVAAVASAVSEPVKQIGLGAHTCGTWTRERQADSAIGSGMGNWVVGYVNGVNVHGSSGRDLLLNTDPNAVIAWVDTYCKSKPLDHIFDAANALAVELVTRASRK